MKKISKQLNISGDTIVEVMIAITVVSMVLAGAYASTRKNANATRTAQEYSEALKLAESQVEQLKIASNTGIPNLNALPDTNFCLDGTEPKPLSTEDVCLLSELYRMQITKEANNQYVVRATWDGLAGSMNAVELVYKVK